MEDATDLRTRRAVLIGAMSAAAIAVISTVGRAVPVSATNDQPVLVGGQYSATTTTQIEATGGQSAIKGISDSGSGIEGQSDANAGVYGYGASGYGIRGESAHGYGVYGLSNTTAIYGKAATGRGAVLAGGKAQLRLMPSTESTHPVTGKAGDVFFDRSHRLWICVGRSWKRIA